ncbi:MAG: YraN family protein, partial [Deltaproteobacteria bacterium]
MNGKREWLFGIRFAFLSSMENQNGVSGVSKKVSITTKSKGELYEKCALAYCRRRRWRVLERNLRLKGGEIDCLAWDSRCQRLVLIEVRGRIETRYSPSKFLSKKKIERLKRLATALARAQKCSIRIVLLEVIGELPKAHLQWGLELFPEKL